MRKSEMEEVAFGDKVQPQGGEMKKLKIKNQKSKCNYIVVALHITSLMLVWGCSICDDEPPRVPVGLYSVTGDEKVMLYWCPNTESDLGGYFIYRSYKPCGYYECIGSSCSAFFVDATVENGVTYYYVVSAYDCDGNESEVSEIAFDTPRPEGRGVRLWNANEYELDSGYDFSCECVQPWDAPSTDMYCILESGVFYMIVADQTYIQDFGYIDELDDIDYAPEEGWSQTGVVELILGHGYIVWTRDNHFAKFRVTKIEDEWIKFDWAYQVDRGNRELAPNPDSNGIVVAK